MRPGPSAPSKAPPRRASAPRRGRRGPGAVVLATLALTTAVELVLWAGDAGLLGERSPRALAYQNGAFWRGLLGNWRPNYAAQPYAMFVSYALLHGGPGHLAGNMITLWTLGRVARDRVGGAGFAALYALSAIGGALGFALLGASLQPVVGASGALHGLAGAWLFWERLDRRAAARPVRPVAWIALGIAALNLATWVWLDGLLAWEAHAGGLVAGWLGAGAMARAGRGRAGGGAKSRTRSRAGGR